MFIFPGPVTPSPDSGCVTVSGGTIGVKCVFPFKYINKEYQGCTVAGVSDGKLWCSTNTDRNGNHIGGGGFWGHCPSRNCQTDQSIVQLFKALKTSSKYSQSWYEELVNKEQTGFKELFTDYQFFYTINLLLDKEILPI